MLALHIYNNKSKHSLKKFFFITFSLSIELLEDKQRFKLGGVNVSVVSTFPNTFALVLDSNLHDLNGTNPD